MPELTTERSRAVKSWIDRDCDGKTTNGERISKVSRVSLQRYIDMECSDIKDATWRKLLPYISRYLPVEPEKTESDITLSATERRIIERLRRTNAEFRLNIIEQIDKEEEKAATKRSAS